MAERHRLLADHDVRDLSDYRSLGGGIGLATCRELRPDDVVELVAASGLRGRGGAGFPTGVKWRTIGQFASPVEPTPVVVNAAEGEPGTFKDRLLLRHDPYLILEGAAIAAFAIGSPHVVVTTKASFTIEIERVRRAIEELRAAGWLNGLTVELATGPSEYLFGEETGLLEVLEGRPPFPRVTPPWRRGIDPDRPGNAHSAADVQLATSDGSASAPALVDNVETLANVPLIMSRGVEWYRSVGTEASPGTVLCTVTGATQRHGVGEFALGTPVGEVIERVGVGPRPDHELVAVLSGVSNPPLPASRLDVPLTYEDLAAAGSGLGSASLIVIDDSVPMRWVAAQAARFLAVESCGQCEPCKRDGLAIDTMLAGHDAVDRAALEGRLTTVAVGARCNLARQTEAVVPGVLALAADPFGTEGPEPAAEDADLMAIVPLVDIIDGVALLDLSHRDKAPDWTYPDEQPSRPVWPIQRLADQPVTLHRPHTPERPPRRPIVVGELDPMAVVSELDRVLRRSIDSLEQAAPDRRDAARAELRSELHRHLDLLERIALPLLDRVRADGADIGRYPDEHARRAHALLGLPDAASHDAAAIAEARTAVDEVQKRVVPLLRANLDPGHRGIVAADLELEAGLLGIRRAGAPVAGGAR